MIEIKGTQQDVTNFKNLLVYLKRLSEDGVNSLIEKQLLLMLDSCIPFFSHLIMKDVFPEIHRLTINKNVLGANKRIREIKYLKYPPAEKVSKYGRCNLPKQSIFYGSFLSFTSMNEMKPQTGDLITESVWRAKTEEPLQYCPIFKNQPEKDNVINTRSMEYEQVYNRLLRDYSPMIKEQIDLLVQFIADGYTKRVHPSNHLNYIFSAYFSNKILYEFEKGEIDAIYYPSVQDNLSFENLAIKPDVFDKMYQLAEVKDGVIIVDPRRGGGGYFSEGLSECKNFDFASGKILWDQNKIYQPEERVAELKMRYQVDLE
ncbi:MAG: hypothetical protein ABI295_05995 [Xanthomarina sp.]